MASGSINDPGWRWSPVLGRWSPSYGLPDLPALFGLSTASLPLRQRYDFWRELVYYNFDADAAPAGADFEAAANGAASQRVELYHYRSDAVRGSRRPSDIAADGGDSITIGFVLAGRRDAEQVGDAAVAATAGMPFVFDAARPATVAWSRHRGVHLMLRRPEVTAMLGSDVPEASVLAARLAGTGLSGLLREQCQATAGLLPGLTAMERGFALEQLTRLLGFALLRTGTAPPADDRGARAGVYVAAMRLIERHLESPQLSPARLCRKLGVSRSTLYRAFADQGIGIAEAIDERRFAAVFERLTVAPPGLAIADVAASCGLYDAANFSRRFRARFGMTPSEARGIAAPKTAAGIVG
jgi:AraC-like DNA-binding protein